MALIPIPRILRCSLPYLSSVQFSMSFGPSSLGGLVHGRLAYRDGNTLAGRVFGCGDENNN